jgi:D-glycero-D-manno-heptose 1,7-bisphosphate phosphatase
MREWPKSPLPRFSRAIFLDRDGTVNIDTHYPHEVTDLHFIEGALEALRILARLPFQIIVVSNQAGIALGLFDHQATARFNQALRERVAAVRGRIDGFYYSPDPEPNDLKPGQKPSFFSKPAPGMLLEAARDFGLDLASSYLVGDKLSDIAAGNAVGCTSILVKTGKAGSDFCPVGARADHVLPDLLGAARWIRAREEKPQPFVRRRASMASP